ncbi:chromosome partitioning protein, ParB family (plasmid) [Calothrix sp. NIES-4101]|nr:chromosome partitioning protein, ParB family [Calothrix sp. NIES-4101]
MDDETVKQVQLIENLQREDLNAYEETIGILELLALRLKMTQDEVIKLLNRMEKANRQKADNVIRHDNEEQADDVIPHNDESEDTKADNVIRSKGKKQADNVIRSEDIEIVSNVFACIGRLCAESFRANRLPLLNLPCDIQQALASGTIEYTKARAIARFKDNEQRGDLLEKAVSQNLSLSQIKELIQQLQANSAQEILPEKVLSQRYSDIGKRLKEAKVWDDAKKLRKVEKLLGDIEKILSGG